MKHEGFYKYNNKVLGFDLDKDLEKIKFNHYICKKENFQRLKKGELPRGQFHLARRTIAKDLNVTENRARTLLGCSQLNRQNPR